MVQVTNRTKPLHQRFSELDNKVFSAFCTSFSGISWVADFKDNDDEYCGIDLQLTAKTKTKQETFDVEIKSVDLNKFLPYCFFQSEKWFSLVEWNNEVKLYFVIYPKHNKIAIWRINHELLRKSDKDYQAMKKNTCRGDSSKTKLVYLLKLSDARIFDFDLTEYKDQYNALYSEIAQKGKQ